MADERAYASLPDLRARAVDERAAGHGGEIAELEARIASLTAEAKREAARLVRERAETKERFQRLIREIRELQGSAAEVPGGPAARDARIRDLTAQANATKAEHDRLNGQIRRFKWYLTGVGESAAGSNAAGFEPSVPETADVHAPDESGPPVRPRRRRWLIPAIAGGVVLVIAGGLFAASLVVDARLEERVEDGLAAALAEQGLDDIVSYDALDVSSIAGTVTAREVAIDEPISGVGLRACAVTVRVPRLEALRAREALLTGNYNDVVLSSLDLEAAGVVGTVPDGPGLRADHIRVAVAGDLDGSMLDESFDRQLLRVRRAEAMVHATELTGVERALLEVLREIGWMGDIRDFLVLDEAYIVLEHDAELRQMTLSDYRLAAPLVAQTGTASLRYAGDPASGDAWLRDIEFDLTNAVPAIPRALVVPGPYEGETVLVDIPSVDFTTGGAMSFADEWMEPELARMAGTVTLTVGRCAVALPPSMVEELAWTLPGAAQLIPDGEISVEEVLLDAELRDGGMIELRDLTLDAPLAAVALSGRARLDEEDAVDPASFMLDGSVEGLQPVAREFLGEIAGTMGVTLPETGPFEFSLSLGEYGEPRLDVR